MKNTLQLRLSQHLTLTPQLQQSIRLLQLSTLELEQEIERYLQDNPLLDRDEEGEDGGGDSPADLAAGPGLAEGADAHGSDAGGTPAADSADSAAGAGGAAAEPDDDAAPERDGFDFDAGDAEWSQDDAPGGARADDDDGEYPQQASDAPTLREHLLGQLGLTRLGERDRALVAMLIEALDESGYLAQSVEELAAWLPPELGVEAEEVAIALRHLQQFEPAGVGARTLAECLTLQLRALPPGTAHRELALLAVGSHLDLLASRDFVRLRKALGCDDAALRGVQALVARLDPRPGGAYARADTRYVVPDVVVRKARGMWVASLNPDAMPKLRINRLYADILRRNRDAAHARLASQLQEAKWLIKNVQQRFQTILRVAQAIVDRQRAYFEHGPVAMRPLVLREIADALELHESTVSRVTTGKYMLTPRGILEFKYFFGSHVSTETGGACSATAIRALIRQMVGAEDTRKPLSDSRIAEILGQQGIVVARRTIAKYRESLQILPVNLRKSL
jgi:RNA polymerase sigma-54 factor